MTISNRPQPLAICLIYRERAVGRDLFVREGFDTVKKSWFYRPLGGGIEFGKRGHETLKREFLEEIQKDLTDIRFLGVLENLFTYAGTPGHELVMVYEGRFADNAVYELDRLTACEDDGSSFTARWLPLTEFWNEKRRLVPEGLFGYFAIAKAT